MKPGFKPRLWQEQALRKFTNANYSALVEAPTAAGKTVFSMMVINQLRFRKPGLRTIVVVPTINLLGQWKKELVKFMGIKEKEIGEYYGGKKESSISKRYMLYVINSAAMSDNLSEQQKNDPFDLIIHDEVHHVGAETYQKLLHIPFAYKLGISATPEREYDAEGTKKILS